MDIWTVSNEPAEILYKGEEIFTKGIDFTGPNTGCSSGTWDHRIVINADSASDAEALAEKITAFLNGDI